MYGNVKGHYNCISELFKKSFFSKTVKVWNHLDDSVVHAQTVDCFRTAVHQRVMSQTRCSHDIDEYNASYLSLKII